MDVQLKPITYAEYKSFFGVPPEKSIRGYSVYQDGKLVAVFGVTMQKNGDMIMFSDIIDNLKAPKITVWRWAKKAISLFSDVKAPIYAITSKSDKFLESLGFTFHNDTRYGRVYLYGG